MAGSDRISALALVAVLSAAWMVPCFLCDRAGETSPRVLARESCHAMAEDASVACAPGIRAAAPALPATMDLAFTAAALATARPAIALDNQAPCPPPVRLAPVASIDRPPVYLLHSSLLA